MALSSNTYMFEYQKQVGILAYSNNILAIILETIF